MIKDKVDLDTISELMPNTRNMSVPEGAVASGSSISLCLPEDSEYGLRDIGVDEGVPSEDKIQISLGHNIYFEKLSFVKPSTTSQSSCCRSGLQNRECKARDASLLGDDDELPYSQLKNRTEDERGISDEACILYSSIPNGKNVPISSRSADYLVRKLEPSSLMQSALLGSIEEKEMIVPNAKSRKNRGNEVDLSACGDGSYDKSVTSNKNCTDEKFEVERKMKERGYLSQNNVEIYLSNMCQRRTNPFAIAEEEQAQFMAKSYSASLESHSELASSSSLAVHVVPEHISEGTHFSKNEQMTLKGSDYLQTDPVLGKQVLSEQRAATELDPKKSVEDPHSDKCGEVEHKKLVEERYSDKCCKSTDIPEKSVGVSVAISAMVDSEATKNVENQGQRTFGSYALAGNQVGQVRSLDMRGNVPPQSINHTAYDGSDKVNGYNNALLSGQTSYSGRVPYSGNTSLGSDSSTASTRSFAFPILANEWNSSPVKMKEADSRYYKKKKRSLFCCFCCRP